jgi:hypothetical protein
MPVSKVLITSGLNLDGHQTTSEIVDLTIRGGNMCKRWPNFPIGLYGATGGFIGNNVIICGGLGSSKVDECYSLTSSKKATIVPHMSVEREHAASIVLNDTTLWVTGGWNSQLLGNNGPLASSDFVTMVGTISGPALPVTLYRHTIVAINSTVSMVIGGADASASTFYYKHNEGEWRNGPSLIEAREDHASGIVTDEVTNENFVAVTGGLSPYFLDSTEILQDGKWVQGKINYMYQYPYASYLLEISGLTILVQNKLQYCLRLHVKV